MISKAEAKALGDSALDTAYSKSIDAESRAVLAVEILNRLAGVRSFITGSLGFVRFPKYNATVGSFKQKDEAQSAVVDNAKNVVSGLGTNLWSIALPVLVVAVVLYILSKKL